MWHERFGNCVAKIEWLDHALGLTARMACQSHCGLSVYGKKMLRPGRNNPGDNYPGGNSPGGNYPGAIVLGGNFPDTIRTI